MKTTTRESGQAAEDQALAYLQKQGLKLVVRNWSRRSGELDLVMLDRDTVVFVEVRSRRHIAWGGAVESIDARKRQRLIATAQLFLQSESCWAKSPCRFDVVALSPAVGSTSSHLEWIKNAFDS
ncbi:YraN family protein [Pseudomonas sp. MAG002Y]|uniref:YraN family protein n=1 Tax=Pseudomonas sp. MAG002Y TaxID=2678690 RepID=UPI001C60EC9B|nr:YraN family protein [Pseudomonas sp. MAG002Y]MBW5414232.1 YraN family protein [Pseudomonas sp. MAG002Y]